jgi:hypothetical protein
VSDPVFATVLAACLLLCVAGLTAAALNRPPGRVLFVAAALAEAVVVALVVDAVVRVAAGERPAEPLTAAAYLVGLVLVLPIAATWSLAERTRWSSLVLAVGAMAVAVMTVRVQQVWVGPGA